MEERDRDAYLGMCIKYRLFAIVPSSILYILSASATESRMYLLIAAGMLSSCFLATWIYKRIEAAQFWMRLMYALESLAYGGFIYVSGGLDSPYLWYQMGCILLMISLERSVLISAAVSLWSFLCAALGTEGDLLSPRRFSLYFGILMVLGGFYVLRFYIRYIEEQKDQLVHLNQELAEEKKRSEHALLQLTSLYETFNLFAIINPERVFRELALLLKRTVAKEGLILLKFANAGYIERVENCGIDEKLVNPLMEEIDLWKNAKHFERSGISYLVLQQGDGDYESFLIGEELGACGAVIRKRSEETAEKEDFYWRLIEIIFKNLDVYAQMEKFITMEEQHRIANEIHDTVIQKLFGMACKLKVLDEQLASSAPLDLREEIAALKQSTERTMTELRESIYGRSFDRAMNTLVSALRMYMQEMEYFSGAQIIMDIDKEADVLTSAQKIAIYRISCEAVNNAIKHGVAGMIDIRLRLDAQRVVLEVEDNGIGIMRSSFREGNGFKNMRNIATLLKGSLDIDSRPGDGTKVRLTLPR